METAEAPVLPLLPIYLHRTRTPKILSEVRSRLNRLIDMQERLLEANRISLQFRTNNRQRSTLVVNASNSGQHGNAEDDGNAVNSVPVQDFSQRLNRSLAMQKSLFATIESRKRKRSTSVVNPFNSTTGAFSVFHEHRLNRCRCRCQGYNT